MLMKTQRIRVWDLPLRLFHWLLVIAVIAAYTSGSLGGLWLDWHARIGAFVFALLIFRIIWGFVGSRYATFASFMPLPHRWKLYSVNKKTWIGHTPFAALAIFCMLGLLLVQTVSGMLSVNEDSAFYAPWYDCVGISWSLRMTSWHAININILLILIAIHVLAVLYHAKSKQPDIIRAMVDGYVSVDASRTYPRLIVNQYALIGAVCVSFIVWYSLLNVPLCN